MSSAAHRIAPETVVPPRTNLTASAAPKKGSLTARLLSVAYGLVSYVAFLGVFHYAIGFAGSLLVPKGINDGPTSPLLTTLLINGGCLALFAVQHTIMARQWFKRWWTQIIPAQIERSTFVLVTCAILTLMFWQWRPMPEIVWQVTDPIGSTVLWSLFAIGWSIVLLSSFLIDHFDLFGLRQVVLYFKGKPYTDKPFAKRGFYKFMRHPLMFGFLIAFWSVPTMTVGHLFFAGMVTGYVLFGVHVEERTLVSILGDRYREYQKTTPMLIPGFRKSA